MKRKNMGEAKSKKQLVFRDTSSNSSKSLSSTTSSSVDRRQPLLDDLEYSSRGTLRQRPTRMAEVAGGTTAECAAVCCCCPCGVVNLLILAIYKVPAELCKKALRKKRRRRMLKNDSGLASSDRSCSYNEQELVFRSSATPIAMANAGNLDKDVMALEDEMWRKFHSSGFLRSNSQSNDVIHG